MSTTHTKTWTSETITFSNGYSSYTMTIWPEIQWYRRWVSDKKLLAYRLWLHVNCSGYSNEKITVYVDGEARASKDLFNYGETKIDCGTEHIGIGSGAGTARIKVTASHCNTKWQCDLDYEAEEYTIYYNANGGYGEPGEQTKVYGKSLTLSFTAPYRTGYSFAGWALSSTGNVQWQPGSAFNLNGSYTLYAKWTANTYRITYHGNGGTGIPSYQTKTYGVSLQLSSTRPTRTGYTFTGWNTSSGGGGDSYQPGGWYNTNAAATLYAQWQIITYTVSYNANGGSNAPSSQTKTYNIDLTLTTATPTRTGYTFKGWATSSSGAVAYAPGARYATNANLTLYAVWEIITYQVKYLANGGENAPGIDIKKYGQTLYLTSKKPTRTNYNFLGWNTKSDGTGTNYASGQAYTTNAALTLYAKWELQQYNIYYNANGGSGAPATQRAGIGTYTALSTTRPTKSTASNTYTVTYNKVESDSTISKDSDTVTVYTIYSFDRWNTRSDGTGTDYYPGQSFKVPAQNTTLYAIYTFTLSGSVALPTGTKTQWNIAYWATSLTDPELNRVGDPYTPNKNITLYAIWAPAGTGGYLRFPSSTGLSGIEEGSRLYLTGFHNPENDGPKTVQSYSYHDGVVELIFAEDFVYAGQQDATEEGLHIYGQGNIVPDFDYICALNNRLWGCNSKTRTIYGSALGDPTDFWTFAGDALDAFQVAVGSGGDFTGAVAMNNNVLFMKQHTIHKILGNFPAEYTLYTYDIDGTSVSNGLSAINCDGIVIFVTEHGIGTYTGSSAGQLSKELGEGNMNHAISMFNGEQYYLHYIDDNGQHRTYIFDTRYNLWVEADYKEAMALAHYEDRDYALIRDDYEPDIKFVDADGEIVWGNQVSSENMQLVDDEDNVIYDRSESLEDPSPEIYSSDGEMVWPADLPHGIVCQIDSGEPYDGDWEILFKPFYESITSSRSSYSHVYEKKQYTGVTFRLELPEGSWIKAELKADDGRWRPVARTAGRKERVQDFVVRTARCDKVQLRLSGHGPMTILSMEREYRIGSRR